jgi:hypothetical protein
MRAAALILVLTLASPAAISAVCELWCLQALHHAAAAADASGCHDGHSAAPGTFAVAGADGARCHDGSEGPTAIVKATAGVAFVPTVVASTPALFGDAPVAHLAPQSNRARPPDVLLVTTQLRI